MFKRLNDYFYPPPQSYEEVKSRLVKNPKLLIGLEIDDIIMEELRQIFKDRGVRFFLPYSMGTCDSIKNRINIHIKEINPEKYIVTSVMRE